MRIIVLLLITMSLIGCSRKHFNSKHPWHPKRKKYLDSRYERCYHP